MIEINYKCSASEFASFVYFVVRFIFSGKSRGRYKYMYNQPSYTHTSYRSVKILSTCFT